MVVLFITFELRKTMNLFWMILGLALGLFTVIAPIIAIGAWIYSSGYEKGKKER